MTFIDHCWPWTTTPVTGASLELRTGLATPIHVIDVLRLTGVHV
ncbi:hypothetical protein [Kutzneria sp. 744]|nr:hypothetical protein [Kutzneria sp. 744]